MGMQSEGQALHLVGPLISQPNTPLWSPKLWGHDRHYLPFCGDGFGGPYRCMRCVIMTEGRPTWSPEAPWGTGHRRTSFWVGQGGDVSPLCPTVGSADACPPDGTSAIAGASSFVTNVCNMSAALCHLMQSSLVTVTDNSVPL